MSLIAYGAIFRQTRNIKDPIFNTFYPLHKTKIKWGWFFKEKDVMKLRIWWVRFI